MKEFNWEGFRSGKFAVHCDTEEKAKDFIREAHKNGIKWAHAECGFTFWCFNKINTCYYGGEELTYGHINNCDIKIIEWRSDNMKNFREVIRDIKEGEVWENEIFEIIKVGNGIEINLKNEPCVAIQGVFLGDNRKFKLKQQPVTLEEVLNSDKRCKVEHELLKDKYYSLYDEFDFILVEISSNFKTKETKEIIKNGKWYLEP